MEKNTTDLEPQSAKVGGITLELPGFKLSITNIASLITFLLFVLILVGGIIYLVGAKSESVATVISSLNPKVANENSNKKEILTFWVPENEDYLKNYGVFEKWLTSNTGWWGKVPMQNTRFVDNQKIILKGYQYISEDPVENSELSIDYQRAIQNKAIQLFGIRDMNLIWSEVEKKETK